MEGSDIISLMEVNMSTGKPHDNDNEEEELEDRNLSNKRSQNIEEMLRPLLQCFLSYKERKKSWKAHLPIGEVEAPTKVPDSLTLPHR